MSFKKLEEGKRHLYRSMEATVDAMDRAVLSRHQAETALRFVTATEPLNYGDPWLLAQSPKVQAFLRSSHANEKSLNMDKLANAIRVQEEMEKHLYWLDAQDELEAFDD